MIEKKVLNKKVREFQIKEYIAEKLNKPGYSHTEMQITPLGERIIVYTSKPGLIVGRKGENIHALTDVLKKDFGLENPQIEVSEISNPDLNPHSVAKHIAHTFERFGPSRFKFMGHKLLQVILNAGATGAEIIISGRGVPGSRSKSWRFKKGHLKKSGDVAESLIKKGFAVANLKSGSVGIKVSILTPDIRLPDEIIFIKEETKEDVKAEKIKEETKEDVKAEKIKETPKKVVKKKEKKPKKKTTTKVKVKKTGVKKKTKKKNGNIKI